MTNKPDVSVEVAKNLWETIKILGLSNDRLALKAIKEAMLANAVGQVMVDMGPPATARDRWMYEQGRLAERDPRSHSSEQAAPKAGQDDAPPGWKKTAYGWAQSGESILAEDQADGALEADLIEAAAPIIRDYVRTNSKFGWRGETQDPNGAHAWLEQYAARDAQGKGGTCDE